MPDLLTPPPEQAFDGTTYEPERDHVRLKGALLRTYERMSDGRWYALSYLAEYVGCSEAAVSARIRDLRKSKYGGHAVECEYVQRGLHRYRLIVRK